MAAFYRADGGEGLIGWYPFARTIDAAKKYVVSSTLDLRWLQPDPFLGSTLLLQGRSKLVPLQVR